ncbi:MAG: hypothetical protein M9921_07260 [Fimbriimonadaceae bacterium]|nr:hypothetical protein [Fimbriimonadaceae bacterium]
MRCGRNLPVSLLLGVLAVPCLAQQSAQLPTGKLITPAGLHTPVGSYPLNMALSPDGKFLVVTTAGYREFLSVIRVADGKLVSQLDFNARPQGQLRDGLYYGLAFVAELDVRWEGDYLAESSTPVLYASRGAQDRISRFVLSKNGKLSPDGPDLTVPRWGEGKIPNHPAGLAVLDERQFGDNTLFVVNNQTSHETDYRASLSLFDLRNSTHQGRIPLPGFPMAVAAVTQGPRAGKRVYVTSERDGVVSVIDPSDMRLLKNVPTGAAPVGLALSPNQDVLYVANSGSDTVSFLSTASSGILATVLLRPDDVRGVPGATPTGLGLSPDGKTLYVTLADLNAIAVVDTVHRRLKGYIPTGWLPTSVVAAPDGKHLFVASAKGIQVRNPNNKPVGTWGQYIQDILEGTVSRVAVPSEARLKSWSKQVVVNNWIRPGISGSTLKGFANPGIQHVIYIVKENRTYDNVFGDLPGGDPSICLFPRPVTPNQHALAERFALLDNFYCPAEVSQDGWLWSTAGMVSAYASRNTPYNYSGRGRSYDTEGSNNGVPVDMIGISDVARPSGGYLWDKALQHGVSFRNYGFFLQSNDPADKRNDVLKDVKDNTPTKRALVGRSDDDFRHYDLSYPDSEAWIKHGVSAPKQLKSFGSKRSPSRFSEWKTEFDGFVKAGEMPSLQLVRFCVNHTAGTSPGMFSPRAMVADNDYAVGQLVEAVSKSPFWKSTLIIVLEDDAQAGYDHIDAHRSIVQVISPYVPRATVDHRFYNTDSALRTIGLVLGMTPLNQYDAAASPFGFLAADAGNSEPYEAILPAKEIVGEVNPSNAYRAKDSARMINLYAEESLPDEELNDVLWGAIKGAKTPRPKVRRGLQIGPKVLKDD